MNDRRPPRMAMWLLAHAASPERRESIVGDVVERYSRGRSPLWFWRQTASAVLAYVWAEKALAVCVLLTSQYLLNWVYMSVLGPAVVRKLYAAWYPPLIKWLLATDLDGVRTVVYRLGLEGLTNTLAWCVMLIAAVLFISSQVGQCLPYVRQSFHNWLEYRAIDPSWFFAFFRFSIFAFVLLPLSVLAGIALHREQQRHVSPLLGEVHD